MVSGSDEHGTPIEVEAIKLGIPPRQLTNKYHKLIVHLLKTFEIEFDNYTRTESPVHKRFVRDFYLEVEKNGYVYSQKITQLYCLKDKRFLPDRFVEGECPYCHNPNARGDQCDNCGRVLDPKDLINPRCALDQEIPVQRESEHWFFDLPKLSEPLRKYVETNPNFPENARNFSLGWIRDGLKPRSLTRDNAWGIPAPFKGAKGKTIYVWMEAVLGYVSATKEWAEKKKQPSLWKKYWFDPQSRNVHFIGKVPKYSATKEQHAKILTSLSHSLLNVDDRLGHFRLKDALEQVVELAREGNRYLNEHEPWRLYKTDAQAAGETLGISIQIVATLGILLQPFLPSASKRICSSLMGKVSLPWKSAGQTIVKPGVRIRPLQPLFHKVKAEKLRAGLEDIRSRVPVEAEA